MGRDIAIFAADIKNRANVGFIPFLSLIDIQKVN
jgi:hypothetical protein